MPSFIFQNLTEIQAVTGCIFACTCHTVFRIFSCLQINWEPFYLRQLLKFHPFDWLVEIYLQRDDLGTYHKMISLQPMPSFSPVQQNTNYGLIILREAGKHLALIAETFSSKSNIKKFRCAV